MFFLFFFVRFLCAINDYYLFQIQLQVVIQSDHCTFSDMNYEANLFYPKSMFSDISIRTIAYKSVHFLLTLYDLE